MNHAALKIVLIGTAFSVLGGTAFAENVDIGEREFTSRCAVCHGTSGVGDGPLAGYLDRKLPDLTALSKSNNGVFPFDRVYRVIDGRQDVAAHGPREMPVWGNEYNDKAAEYYSDYIREYDAASFVRGRILALISYIYGLQKE